MKTVSYLTVEQDGLAVRLLHGTCCSRVWLPVLGRLAKPGHGPSRSIPPDWGILQASSPWTRPRSGPRGLGGVIRSGAENFRTDRSGRSRHRRRHRPHTRLEVSRLALVNSVTYDAWPAPHVARFRAGTTDDDDLAARRQAVMAALGGCRHRAANLRLSGSVDHCTSAPLLDRPRGLRPTTAATPSTSS